MSEQCPPPGEEFNTITFYGGSPPAQIFLYEPKLLVELKTELATLREELRVEHGLCVSRGEQVVKLDGELQEAVARNKGLEDALAAAVRDLERTESSRIAGALTGLLGEVRVLRDDNAKLSKMMRAFAKVAGKPRKAKPKKGQAKR